MFYDEVISSAYELTGEDDKGRLFPKCCNLSYLSIKKKFNGKVFVEDWIDFWFGGDLVYPRPPVRKGRRTHRPKFTHNHSGLTKKRQSWNDTVAQAYVDLGVENSERMDVYLVAFFFLLALCFCLFKWRSKVFKPRNI